MTARLIMVLLLGVLTGGGIAYRSCQEANPDPEYFAPRYAPYITSFTLPLLLVVLLAASLLRWGVECAVPEMLSMCFSIFLHISVYYALLLCLLPLLRRSINSRTCATLWLLPNYLYYTMYSWMSQDAPRWILHISSKTALITGIVWFIGACAVLLWNTGSHLLYRLQILKDARPVTDPEILDQWTRAQQDLGIRKANLRLVRSPEVRTPLSIGFFRRSIRVVLPEQNYTPAELDLLFRHELIHITREDCTTKFFLVFCTAMCWFNPLMWAAMRRSADDLELSCDETVLLNAEDATRRQYADLLLRTAGDSRGFTTCLSVSASALRYRLKNIVKPRRRFSGAIITGALFAALFLTFGYVGLSYGSGTGSTYIFGGDPGQYTVNSSSVSEASKAALTDYLAELELSKISGNYDFLDEEDQYHVRYRGPDGLISVTLNKRFLTVTTLSAESPKASHYCLESEVDWDYLNSLIE